MPSPPPAATSYTLSNKPAQISVPSEGCTVVNTSSVTVTLSSESESSSSITQVPLPPNATMPWPHGPLYASGNGATISVVKGTYNISNPNVNASITATDVTVTGGTVDVQNTPGSVLQTGAIQDLIDTVVFNSGTTTPITFTVTPTKLYDTLFITMERNEMETSRPRYAIVTDSTLTFAPAFGAPIPGSVNSVGIHQCQLPIAYKVGDNLTFTIWLTGNISASWIVQVFGTTLPLISKFRSQDGRAYPVGLNSNGANIGAGQTTLVAHVTNFWIMIKELIIYGGTKTSVVLVTKDNGSIIILGANAGEVVTKEWEDGFLCDPNTGIFAECIDSVTNTGGAAWITYDLVV